MTRAAVTGFGEVGDDYGSQLARGLSLTGESAEYYARKRVARARELAAGFGVSVRAILDFGCGTGASLGILRDAFPDAHIVGFEPEQSLLEVARSAAAAAHAQLVDREELIEEGFADVVYCNGVFHHIEQQARAPAARRLSGALRMGGVSVVWENSPFNPGTRMVMARIPFDRDAVLLTPRQLRSLQRDAGITPVATEFHFVFPRPLRFARPLEKVLRSLPLGGQYVVVGRRVVKYV